jgi:heterodisulfide reductase subunit A
MKPVIIVGSGIAGLTAALSLHERGIACLVIEQDHFLGGAVRDYACKGIVECVRCDVCLVINQVREIKLKEVPVLKGHEAVGVEGRLGDMRVRALPVGGGEPQLLKASAVILATGTRPFDATLDVRLGYGIVRGVVTADEVERQLSTDGTIPLADPQPKRMAFVQCVGSRQAHGGSVHCSQACCKYAFKLAQLIKRLHPQIGIDFLFMDWRAADARDDIYAWAERSKDIALYRTRPSEIVGSDNGRPTIRYASSDDVVIHETEYDLVVLSVGMMPRACSKRLAERIGLETDDSGFFISTGGHGSSSKEGVFMVGSCREPMDIAQSAKDGLAVASLVASSLEGVE